MLGQRLAEYDKYAAGAARDAHPDTFTYVPHISEMNTGYLQVLQWCAAAVAANV